MSAFIDRLQSLINAERSVVLRCDGCMAPFNSNEVRTNPDLRLGHDCPECHAGALRFVRPSEKQTADRPEPLTEAMIECGHRAFALVPSGVEYTTAAYNSFWSALAAVAKAAVSENELTLRRGWWLSHDCGTPLRYGDDGEMQCANCKIDFRRDAPRDIEARLANHKLFITRAHDAQVGP